MDRLNTRLSVADPFDQVDLDPPLVTPRRTPSRAMLVSLAVFAVSAVAAAYFWLAAPVAVPGVTLQDLHAAQQQTTSEIEAINRNAAAAQADLKKLSDQLSALAARVDALKSAATPPSPPPDSRAQMVTAPSKKPSQTPKPAGPASIGGAPTGTAQKPDQR